MKLKPCPFCGGRVRTCPAWKDKPRWWIAECEKCAAVGPGQHTTARHAEVAWERRFPEKVLQKRLAAISALAAKKAAGKPLGGFVTEALLHKIVLMARGEKP